MTSKIEQLELLKAMAEGKPYYHMEVLSYNEALRNSAPLLLEIVKAAKAVSKVYPDDSNRLHNKLTDALKKFEEV